MPSMVNKDEYIFNHVHLYAVLCSRQSKIDKSYAISYTTTARIQRADYKIWLSLQQRKTGRKIHCISYLTRTRVWNKINNLMRITRRTGIEVHRVDKLCRGINFDWIGDWTPVSLWRDEVSGAIKGRTEGAQLSPSALGEGHQNFFMINDHKSEYDKVCY